MKKSLFLGLFLLSAALSSAQTNFENGVVSAMGNSGSAYVGGALALGLNPSRLLSYEYFEQKASIAIFPVGFTVNNNSISATLYNELFGKKTRGARGNKTEWTDSDKRKLLEAIGDELEVNARASIMLLGASYFHDDKVGAFGFHIIDHVGGRGTFNREFLEYSLYGNERFLGREVGGARNTTSNAYWYREYALSYAREFKTQFRARSLRPIESVKVGASLKWIAAHAYSEAQDESRIYHSPTGDSLSATVRYVTTSAARGKWQDPNSTESFSFFPESVGSGVGIDLGISFNYRETMTFAASLNNLGFVSFGDNALVKTADTTVSFAGLNDPISGSSNKNQLDSIKNAVQAQTRKTDRFTRALPIHLRLGFGLILDDHLDFPAAVTVDYVQGFNGNFGNTGIPILGIGGEIRPIRSMPLRSGMQFGGRQGFAWSFGIGYDNPNLAIDFNVGNIFSPFFPSRIKNLTFGLALRGRFLGVER
ncbi:MAG: DUF5723 family protein [Chloroherpetonaceae bacterium]|nr:DUF5723 family protein [Chloroherpetonaceae bacterium]